MLPSLNNQGWASVERYSSRRAGLFEDEKIITNEPSGLLRADGMRPDGVTLLPWKQGKWVTWDVTVSNTFCRDAPDSRRGSRGGSREKKTNTHVFVTD